MRALTPIAGMTSRAGVWSTVTRGVGVAGWAATDGEEITARNAGAGGAIKPIAM
jgi:hypothetical protein